jgi:hypothetical protein
LPPVATFACCDEATGFFDAIVDVGYPTRIEAARMLTALITGLPDADTVRPRKR